MSINIHSYGECPNSKIYVGPYDKPGCHRGDMISG